MIWEWILCIVFGYLVGVINPSYIIGRLQGFDIRKKGSGNAGASNAVILMGKKVGILTAIFDILKAAVVVWTAPLMFSGLRFAGEIAGAACILGHIFPFYMKFRGGKGLACLGGVVLGFDWKFFLILLAVELALVLLVDYICIVPITASIALPFLYVWLGRVDFINASGDWWGALILGVAMVGILSRHWENLVRIHKGTELHFSYLWRRDKDEELARVQKNREA